MGVMPHYMLSWGTGRVVDIARPVQRGGIIGGEEGGQGLRHIEDTNRR
jgi:hypothetical protein